MIPPISLSNPSLSLLFTISHLDISRPMAYNEGAKQKRLYRDLGSGTSRHAPKEIQMDRRKSP